MQVAELGRNTADWDDFVRASGVGTPFHLTAWKRAVEGSFPHRPHYLMATRNGALEGVKPEEAYFVKCDRTTMTQADIDNGRLIVVVGVAPVKPAEFVIIRIGLLTRSATE